jgi:hypothetical protein
VTAAIGTHVFLSQTGKPGLLLRVLNGPGG